MSFPPKEATPIVQGEQPLGPGRIVLYYMPDKRRQDSLVTPFPAIVVEVDPDTGRPSLHVFTPWEATGDYRNFHERVERVVEGDRRAWRWDWPNLQTWAWRGP